jgi:SEC-C motif domain protein
MRSRYAGFALREAAYLWKTLHSRHEDRAVPEAEGLRSIRAAASTFKYTGLTVLDRRAPDESGIARVLFVARVFEKGRDRSFVELSEFAKEADEWRYLRGELMATTELTEGTASLTIDRFVALRPPAIPAATVATAP